MNYENEQHKDLKTYKRSMYQMLYSPQNSMTEIAQPVLWVDPSVQIQAYERQVAGHRKIKDFQYLGLLQCSNGTILKPLLKETQKREVDFYKMLLKPSGNNDLEELKRITPKYFGCKKFSYNGFENDYIILEDLTQRMIEPCIMDVKMGKRTWDPEASDEKILNEKRKYSLSKEQYGFCIPGYQVYKVCGGMLHKYDKEHGKRLHGDMVEDALREYLNADGHHICRALLLQFLLELWRIQKWAARQTSLRLYSSSLLLVYDTVRLRNCCGGDGSRPKCRPALTRRKTFHCGHRPSTAGLGFSGQLSSKGPVFRKVNSVPLTSLSIVQSSFNSPPKIHSPWTEALDNLNHSHSFSHNYEDKLVEMKMDYKAKLDELTEDLSGPKPLATAKLIDFVHAFTNDDATLDYNFKEAIDNFVSVFESFLKETEQ